MSRFVVKIDKYDKIIYYDLLMREIKIVNKNSLNTKFESYDSDERIALMNYINNKIKYSNDTLSITDAITYDCNLSCVYCMQNGPKIDKTQLEIETVKKVELYRKLLSIFNPKSFIVTFFGGEPSLKIDYLQQVLEQIESEEKFKQFNIISNGNFVFDDLFSILNHRKFGVIQLTLDGPRELHNARRPRKDGASSWDRIMDNMSKIFCYSNSTVVIHTVLDETNSNFYYKKMLDELVEIFGVKVLSERVIFNIGLLTNPENGGLSLKGINICQKEYAEKYVEAVKSVINFGFRIIDFLNVWPCTYKKESDLVLAPNGDVYNCISGIGVSNFKIANYEEIMSNEEIFIKKYANFLESISHDKTCMSCTFLPICDGGCKYNSFLKQTPKDCWKEFLETLYSSDLIELYVLNQERVIVP
ncbi:LOW QUALITY PROTEIN: radical SAM additional 4Fe4S-binding domain protein [Fervidobacterium pennivorans DSM 9078]|uniref:Radical SAM additional 4Fe4S-binding domain protein n=1 Tax=Fervidobacterium pennivorans (strain DSM 9078 / Ven5) TaxID=771875 RepID=H9UBB0_FERPD|nr:LOW QUALITY PROTEIN: radical SAM additional 4Fe4S-binding domain protein [Fervidobacterium pennivorans DSM 9078]